MPDRFAVDHKTVFDALGAALAKESCEVFLLNVFTEDVLVLFIYNLLAVTDDILEEIITALLKA